ncbi:MAG: hypothetical protein ACE5IR_10885 [bacterium]
MTNLKPFFCLLTVLFVFWACTKERTTPLEGAWKMVKGTYTDLESNQKIETDESQRFCIKIMSGHHFSVIEMFKDKPDSLFFAAVGTYKLSDDVYTETYEASNVGYQIGASREFVYNLQEDRWTLNRSQEEMDLQETWVRVAQK